MTTCEPAQWGSRKTIRRGSAKPGSSVNSNDRIFDYLSTRPSWHYRAGEADAR
jgi:hypothetical protein